jgi:hypothetical protein
VPKGGRFAQPGGRLGVAGPAARGEAPLRDVVITVLLGRQCSRSMLSWDVLAELPCLFSVLLAALTPMS